METTLSTMFVAYVSVSQSFRPSMTIAELEAAAASAWGLSLAKGRRVERLIAVLDGHPIAAWECRDAYPTDYLYSVAGGERPRIAFDVGAPLPVLPAYHDVPGLRRGIATAEIEVGE